MASAKTTATTRRASSSRRSPSGAGDEHISPARWGGVALVIAALLGAIALAVLSPSQPSERVRPAVVAAEPSPSPTPVAAGALVPSGTPTIRKPADAHVTGDYAIAVRVEIPEEDIPRQDLELVILRDGEEAKRKPRPKPGSTVTVQDVQLNAGSQNELAVVLEGPDGQGPVSDAVTVTHDEDAPDLEITAPPNGHRTYAKSVDVTGVVEAGSKVTVRNKAIPGWEDDVTVGVTGEFTMPVRLAEGKNVIVLTAEDDLKRKDPDPERVRVVQEDGTPQVKVKVVPKKLKRSALPDTDLKVVVTVTDARGDAMEDASVAFTLGGGIATRVGEETTNESGKATWRQDVPAPYQEATTLQLTVSVTTPHGDKTKKEREIALS